MNTAGLLYWQTQSALSQTDSCCLSFVPMINALKVLPGSAQQDYVDPLHILSSDDHINICSIETIGSQHCFAMQVKILRATAKRMHTYFPPQIHQINTSLGLSRQKAVLESSLKGEVTAFFLFLFFADVQFPDCKSIV